MAISRILSARFLFWESSRDYIANPNIFIERLPTQGPSLNAQRDLFEHFWVRLCQSWKLGCGKANSAFVRKLNPHTPVFDPASDSLWRYGFQFSGGHEIDDKLRLRNRNSPQPAFEGDLPQRAEIRSSLRQQLGSARISLRNLHAPHECAVARSIRGYKSESGMDQSVRLWASIASCGKPSAASIRH
jgi:hypothetical protein